MSGAASRVRWLLPKALAALALAALAFAGVLLALWSGPADAATTPTVNNTVASTATVKTCDGGTAKLKAEEKRVLDLHNATRKKHALGSLCVNPELTRAARVHSKEMLGKRYFRHESFDGETVGARLKRFGYDWYTSGENIAWGTGSMSRPDDRFRGWMESPGHRANILNGAFREVGIGTASGDPKKSDKQVMYTVDFGSRR